MIWRLLRDNGFRLLAMTPNPAARARWPRRWRTLAEEQVAILVGAEGPGLTERAMRASDVRVRIPMSRGTDSLNVATAAALAFYERARVGGRTRELSRPVTDDATPWGTGLTVAAFVAAVTAAAIIVLSLGLTRVHPLLAVGLNIVAVGGLAPTVWGWRARPVWRWFVLGSGVGRGRRDG